jgi:hypothetical protein
LNIVFREKEKAKTISTTQIAASVAHNKIKIEKLEHNNNALIKI